MAGPVGWRNLRVIPEFARPRVLPPLGPRDHFVGPEQAPMTLLEFGDYQCPQSGSAWPAVRAVLGAAGSELRFVFRHFPLALIHPFAPVAAQAAEAAGAQGKFWEMHAALFENQQDLRPEALLPLAERLGLDVARIARELEAGVHAPRVREDFLSGLRSGVNRTPAFFVNGERYHGALDPESLLSALGLG